MTDTGTVATASNGQSASTTQVVPVQPITNGTGDRDLLQVDGLKVYFPITSGVLRRRTGWVRAVDGVSFTIRRGETLGLVGESGSGKTTIGRTIVRVTSPIEGSLKLDGEDLLALKGSVLRRNRRRFQMVFQDPYSSLDPRQTVGDILAEPLRVHGLASGRARTERVAELLTLVGLDPAFVERYPHEFSGGQRQRIGIARALAVEPELIVCDEPISALDVSIQAQVINLLERLQTDLGLTVEIAPSDVLYREPLHPYTVALLSAVPVPDAVAERSRQLIILPGDIPSPSAPPPGCRFHTRCWLREKLGNPEICQTTDPPLETSPLTDPDQSVACHFVKELKDQRPSVVVPTSAPNPAPAGAEDTSAASDPPAAVAPD
jgi:oligopeptide/dipeptide ABC transporter ATP-binding protein